MVTNLEPSACIITSGAIPLKMQLNAKPRYEAAFFISINIECKPLTNRQTAVCFEFHCGLIGPTTKKYVLAILSVTGESEASHAEG